MTNQDEQVVAAGRVVAIQYTLKDADGELIDDSSDDGPLFYLHGADNIVPGLEEGLLGRSAGERVLVEVPPDQGYGPHDPQGVQVIDREVFPDDVDIEVGMHFGAEGPDGEVVPVWVTAVEEDKLTVDLNHPLAGKVLHFDVTIEGVRQATEQELEHGHPHEDNEDCDVDSEEE